MKLDFSSLPLRDTGFSTRPTTILDAQPPKGALTAIVEMAMLETGPQPARDSWQKGQLRNLLRHASDRSGFWRARIGGQRHVDIPLQALPVLTRTELQQQVSSEGSLLHPRDRIPIHQSSTSGSSGTPVRFFTSEVNRQYTGLRSVAQFFLEGADFSLNCTRAYRAAKDIKKEIIVQRSESWVGDLAPLVKSGAYKNIDYVSPDPDELVAELKKDAVGYLVGMPNFAEIIIASHGPEILRDIKVKQFVPRGEGLSRGLLKIFSDLDIPVRDTYSCEEMGPLAFECMTCRGHYHVATSNVIIEQGEESYGTDGKPLHRLLVTHLHSYATPMIRYDLGDLGDVLESCPCGHGGPTVARLYGRVIAVLKHADGRVSQVHIRGPELQPLVKFTDYRIRQTAIDKLVIEIGGRTELSPEETTALTAHLRSLSGPDFTIEIRATPQIDWGPGLKRLAFKSEIA